MYSFEEQGKIDALGSMIAVTQIIIQRRLNELKIIKKIKQHDNNDKTQFRDFGKKNKICHN